MSINSLRPNQEGRSINRAGPAYSAYKLTGSCYRCSSRTHQCINIKHPIFKLLCPPCVEILAERKAAKKLETASVDKNSLLAEPKTP